MTNNLKAIATLVLVVAASRAVAQSETQAACDDVKITWHLPVRFEAVQQSACSQKKILLVNRVSLGIDRVGARDATKGKT
ncbi:MAG: hypothetical protein V3W41_00790 [Planctomycetota bacterium]